ncbi:MAG: hypothetical protein GOMPHAMPRED_000987 [Gomphillus americanus]|uniref:Subtilisin-like serine protease n=1 Tax=Gomphillus americanus TaxID=1940652 RepID=A0A8H3II29_9LECA|nr:MAG: hypothetical protein GOMPHAMPRED_000987 [Gomphillus americanus]
MDSSCPFDKEDQLGSDVVAPTGTLPGYPRVSLDNRNRVKKFLEKELYADLLESMAPRLWWMAKQDSRSISALHRQLVRSRRIVITEDPKLHLVWFNDRIFIKPLPGYLLSHSFWTEYLANPRSDQEQRTTRAALGFLRTYFYLIQHPSDFRMATAESARLVPPGVTYFQFCQFSKRFDKIKDEDVTWRYAYGELRLSRLNFYVKVFGSRWSYHRTELQYGAYFARFYGPFLFLFGCISVVLSAMQTELAAEQVGLLVYWINFQNASRGFCVFALFLVMIIVLTFTTLWLYKFLKEWHYALKDRFDKRRPIHDTWIARSQTNMSMRKRTNHAV